MWPEMRAYHVEARLCACSLELLGEDVRFRERLLPITQQAGTALQR